MPVATHCRTNTDCMATETEESISTGMKSGNLVPRRAFGQRSNPNDNSTTSSERIDSLIDRFDRSLSEASYSSYGSYFSEDTADSGFFGSVECSSLSSVKESRSHKNVPAAFHRDEDGDNMLMLSVVKGSSEITQEILKTVTDSSQVNLKNNFSQTVLHTAALTKQPSIVRQLLVSGCNPLTQDCNGRTALHIATEQGDIDSIKALTTPIVYDEVRDKDYVVPYYELSQSLSICDYEGRSPLQTACCNGDLSTAEFLLSLPTVDINMREAKAGFTALHLAVQHENEAMVQLLLKHQAEPKIISYAGYTALDYALQRNISNIVQHLESSSHYWLDEGCHDDGSHSEGGQDEISFSMSLFNNYHPSSDEERCDAVPMAR